MDDPHLNWQQAFALAAGLLVVAAALLHYGAGRWRAVGPIAREAGLVAGLFGMWQLAGMLSHSDTDGAFARARWIARAEHALHLPAEADLQRPLLTHTTLAWWTNEFYARAHLTGMGVLLVWLFWRHRDHYPLVRNVVAVFTLAATLIQLVPVAPPRLLPELGNIDVAAHYGQSVYTGGFADNELLAMPSIHVGWALIIGVAAVWAGRGPWRWCAPAYPVAMIYAVVATGNHWGMDGLVAAALAGAAAFGLAFLGRRHAHRPALPVDAAEPVAVPGH